MSGTLQDALACEYFLLGGIIFFAFATIMYLALFSHAIYGDSHMLGLGIYLLYRPVDISGRNRVQLASPCMRAGRTKRCMKKRILETRWSSRGGPSGSNIFFPPLPVSSV